MRDALPTPVPLRLVLASRFRKMGLNQLALLAFQAAARHHPEDPRVERQLCEHLLRTGDAEAAVQVARQAVSSNSSPLARLVLARALAQAGHLDEAEDHFSRIAREDTSPAEIRAQALVASVDVAVLTDHPRRAQALARQAALLDPLPMESARLLGDLAGRMATWRTVYEEVERRRQERAQDPVSHYLAARLLASAQSHREPGIPHQEIERLLRVALGADAGCHLARLMLALRQARRRFSAQGRARAAALDNLRFLSQALRLDPEVLGTDAGLIDLLLGALLEETPEAHRQAVDAYLAGLRRLPGHAVAATNLGALYLRRGEIQAARLRLISALAAAPDYEPAYRHLVRTLDLTASPEQTAREVEALVTRLGAPRAVVTGRFVAAMAEDAREQALSTVAGKATQLLTQLGVVAARLAPLPMLASPEEAARLADLEQRLDALHGEWRQYARSLETPGDAHAEVLDLRQIVKDAVRQETQNDGRATIETGSSAFPDVRGHRLALTEAVQAIVSNGLEAQAGASPPLEVRLVPLDTPATRVELTVRDYGDGIHALSRAQLFSPGYTTKLHRPGYGLSVARRIANAHQGWIVVEPAPERGTRVRLVLPADLYGLPAQLDAPDSL